MLGADLHALSAGLTFFLIYYSHTVLYMNGIKGTGLFTGSESQAATVAGFRSASGHKAHHTTVLDAIIIIIRCGPLAVTLTMHIGYLALGSLCFYTHDGGDFFADFLSAYGTGVHRSLSLCNGSCQTGTSGEAATTTVISGKGS